MFNSLKLSIVVTAEIFTKLINRTELFIEILVKVFIKIFIEIFTEIFIEILIEILAEVFIKILAEIFRVKASLVIYYLGFSVS